MVVAAPTTPVAEAVETLTKKRIGVIVVTGPDRSVAGILSERDIVRALAGEGASSLDRPAEDFMSANVVIV